MPTEPTYGRCSNCGSILEPQGTHGENCGCGYALSAHELNCFGRDGRSPHPRMLAELEAKKVAVAAAKAATAVLEWET